MTTKTDEQKDREAYKQELLHCSNWNLRKRGVSAGVPVMEMKAAEVKSAEDMVELILEKYDEGWRPAGEALNEATEKPKAAKAKKQNGKGQKEAAPAPAPEPAPEPQQEEAVDPWDQAADAGTDGDDDLLSELGLNEGPPEGILRPDADELMLTTPPPTYAAPTEEVSGVEDKIDQIQDLLTDVAAVVVEVNNTVAALEAKVQAVHLKVAEHKEIAVRAWALLCNRVGVKNLSAALKKGSEKAKSLVNDE